jgi:hypothetical protein
MDLKGIGRGIDLSGSEWRPVPSSCGRSNEPGASETEQVSQAPVWSSTNVGNGRLYKLSFFSSSLLLRENLFLLIYY